MNTITFSKVTLPFLLLSFWNLPLPLVDWQENLGNLAFCGSHLKHLNFSKWSYVHLTLKVTVGILKPNK